MLKNLKYKQDLKKNLKLQIKNNYQTRKNSKENFTINLKSKKELLFQSNLDNFKLIKSKVN